ncbi:MAG: hypothetical protein KA981_02785 [Bacteroidia bacterium]|nr:hypothetical protein [Bacteroidia bacterium]
MKEELQKLYNNAKALQEVMRFSVWNDTDKISQYGSFRLYAKKYLDIAHLASKYIDVTLLDGYNVQELPNPFNLTWPQQKTYFDGILMNVSLPVSIIENNLDIKFNKMQELKNFFSSNLRKAIFEMPTCERDIQDSIEKLLIGKGYNKGIDYGREIVRVSISNKEVIPDFIFMKDNLALEIKFSRDIPKTKLIVDEINADIQSYSKSYTNLLFLIYDIGAIWDEDQFKNDLDNAGNVQLIIVKH